MALRLFVSPPRAKCTGWKHLACHLPCRNRCFRPYPRACRRDNVWHDTAHYPRMFLALADAALTFRRIALVAMLLFGQQASAQPAVITNTAQFWNMPAEGFLKQCRFDLTGVVTLVDTNRSFVTLQDESWSVDHLFQKGGLDSSRWPMRASAGEPLCAVCGTIPGLSL